VTKLLQALRSIYIWLAIGLGTAVMYFIWFPIFLITSPFDRTRRLGHWYATVWGRGILWLNPKWSWRVVSNDKIPRGRPLVVVSNHQGMGDIMMAFTLDLHFKWISKSANFYVPFMGWMMHHAGYIPLHRGKRSSIERCMERARWFLDRGVSVLFFPEGTRSRDERVQAFKPGAFRLAIDGGFDVLPLAITGTANALPKGTWLYSNERACMQIHVGEVISTKGMTEKDLETLMTRARNAVIALKAIGDGYEAPLRAAG
jgi:1-acyl-sn-glycerol-3-phosphate acyltransferase